MKKYSATIEYSWCMGHRLSNGYEGPCSNLHGHNYRAIFCYESTKLNSIGFIEDFKVLKSKIASYIDSAYDHKMLIGIEDELRECLIELPGVVLFDNNPTAENLAREIYLDLKFIEDKDDLAKLVSVEVRETDNFTASYGEHE